jgi:hypothetical protein
MPADITAGHGWRGHSASVGPTALRYVPPVRRAVVSPTLLASAICTLALSGCTVGVPEGKRFTIDTAAWAGSAQCSTTPCALDAYEARTFETREAVPGALVDGVDVQVHCFAPTPAPMADPTGREVYRWYLLTVDDRLLWAPDLVLTSDANLRLDELDPGEHLAAELDVCHSGVPGR